MNKNILFIESSIPPSRGGVQRVSWLLSEYFESVGYNVYFAYYLKDYDVVSASNKLKYYPEDSIESLINMFVAFIEQNNIHFIICQGLFSYKMSVILSYLKKKNNCRIICCFHNNPGFEKYRPISLKNKVKFFIKKTLLPWKTNKNWYKILYSISDSFVLLSNSFKKDFALLNGINDVTKLEAIPNPLSFTSNSCHNDFLKRKKQVLIISRLEEAQKNIKSALRIWKLVENSGKANEWELILGGYGPDEEETIEYAKSLKLRNFKFIGKVECAQKLYEDSQLFMMTSKYEGFGMTLTEAQQCGCIPIAYDTYSSVHDIITEGKDGFIIPPFDETKYADIVIKLINNDIYRKQLSNNCMISCEKFSLNNIGNKWVNLLNKLD